jgi:hypothetical protein
MRERVCEALPSYGFSDALLYSIQQVVVTATAYFKCEGLQWQFLSLRAFYELAASNTTLLSLPLSNGDITCSLQLYKKLNYHQTLSDYFSPRDFYT